MRKRKEFEFGTCTVPDGKRGLWSIETFTVSERDARMFNLGNMFNPGQWIDPGTYRRLRHKERGIVMSNTPMEVRSNYDAYLSAHNRVLINGLGLGMLLEGILRKPDVTYVRVIEVDPDVIRLTGDYYLGFSDKLEIVEADAYEYRPKRGEFFDYVWHDIWDDINADNLPLMSKLTRRYNKRVATSQGVWSRDMIRADQRRRYF